MVLEVAGRGAPQGTARPWPLGQQELGQGPGERGGVKPSGEPPGMAVGQQGLCRGGGAQRVAGRPGGGGAGDANSPGSGRDAWKLQPQRRRTAVWAEVPTPAVQWGPRMAPPHAGWPGKPGSKHRGAGRAAIWTRLLGAGGSRPLRSRRRRRPPLVKTDMSRVFENLASYRPCLLSTAQ